jgi:acetyl esterase
VVSIDYRLAPEYKFPTASDDAWDAVQFVAREAASLGLDGSRLALGGDSAGGTLAAVCAVMARDAGMPLALQLLFYPGTTAHQDTPSHERFACGPLLDEPQHQLVLRAVRAYAGRPRRLALRTAATRRTSTASRPPGSGWPSADPLVDEGVAYADKLRAAGVPVDLEIYRGVIHEFIKMGRAIPEALQAHADAARALKEALTP